MPELEEEELALIYEAKGVPRDGAREMAQTMMQDPVRALETQVREELNIHPAELAPLKDGLDHRAPRPPSAPSSRSCRSW